MNTLSFMSANFVARQLNYQMSEGWMQGDRATNDYFRPIETFEQRFGEMLGEVAALGFTAIDLWTGHLNPQWASDQHIAIARALLAKHGLIVASLAGGFGSTAEELTRSCRLANAMGTIVLGGGSPLLVSDRPSALAILRNHGVKLGIENHPEKTPAELLAKIGSDGHDVVGAAVDTGWFGTQGYDAAHALRELAPHLFHVHLKDVLAAGAHETCALGKGVVPIQQCVAALKALGYRGGISIEHEPEHYDPREDCRQGLLLVQGWLI